MKHAKKASNQTYLLFQFINLQSYKCHLLGSLYLLASHSIHLLYINTLRVGVPAPESVSGSPEKLGPRPN